MGRVSTAGLGAHRVAMAAYAAVLLLASPLVGAQKPPAPPAPPTAPPAAVSGATLERVRAAGTIRLGYRADARPFSYKNGNEAIGYAAALCQKVADAVKAQPGLSTVAVEWVPVRADARLAAVQKGDVDLSCGPDAITLANRRQVGFSIPVFPGGVGALLRADAPVRLREILAGRTPAPTPVWRANAASVLRARAFSVVAGSQAQQWLAARMQDLNVTAAVAPVFAIEDGVQEVVDRKVDVFFGERSVLLDAAKRVSPGQLLVIDRLFTYSPLAMTFRRGDDDFQLIVDRTLSRSYVSGEIGSLYAKWFGEPDSNTLTFFRWNALPD